MVLCKFYQQGNCRYGDRCRYEHPRGGYSNNNNNNAYKWYGDGRGGSSGQAGGRGGKGVTFNTQNRFESLSLPDNRTAAASKATSQLSQVLSTSPNEIFGSIAGDMTTWEQSKMWYFSCYSYWKDGACLPGFEDVSPEEMRLEAYTAQKSGNIQAYILKMNDMVNKLRQLRAELIRPSMQTKQKLMQFLEEEKRRIDKQDKGISPQPSSSMPSDGAFSNASSSTGSFGGNTGFDSMSTTGVFGNASQPSNNLFGQSSTSTTSQSIFGGSSSAFGQPASNPTQPSSFASLAAPVQNSSAGNVFGGITSFGGGGGFGSSPSQTSIFGNTSEKSAFGSVVAPTGQTTFGTAGATGFGSSGAAPFGSGGATPFGSAGASPLGPTSGVTPFGATPFASTGASAGTSVDQAASGQGFVTLNSPQTGQTRSTGPRSSVYTPLEELTVEERQQFEAARFTPGKLPTRPPPKELCS